MEVPPNQLGWFIISATAVLAMIWIVIQIWQALRPHPEPSTTYATKHTLDNIEKKLNTDLDRMRVANQASSDRNEAMIKTEIRHLHKELSDFKQHYAAQSDKRREAVDQKLELMRQESIKQHEAQQTTLLELTKAVASLQTETAMIYRQLNQQAEQVAKTKTPAHP